MMWVDPDDVGDDANMGSMEDVDPQEVFTHPPITNEDELAVWMSVAEVQVRPEARAQPSTRRGAPSCSGGAQARQAG